jgi:hypothetical protein
MHDVYRCRAARWLAALWFIGCLRPEATRAVEPVVPGFYRLRDEAKNVSPAELGQLLISELNCASCHAPHDGASARVAPKGAPDLSTLGARATPQWIRAYLINPHKVKPGATMPDLLHAHDPAAKADAIESLIRIPHPFPRCPRRAVAGIGGEGQHGPDRSGTQAIPHHRLRRVSCAGEAAQG